MPTKPVRSSPSIERCRLLARLACVFALIAAAGCKLGLGKKSSCVIDADCFSPQKCVDDQCIVPEAGPATTVQSFVGCSVDNVDSCADAGASMTCFQASSLAGGRDFCAPTCDPGQAPADSAHFACTAQGVLLQRCHPSSGGTAAADCPSQFNCYRTNLSKLADIFSATGLCIPMTVCTQNSDCPSAVYNTCASTLVASLSPAAASELSLDHLNCVETDCMSQHSDCSALEGCLLTQYSALADFCVPRCDSKLRCPPNYSCLGATSGPGSPNLCIPALPGTRCQGDQCAFGSCDDTGAGFNACTIDCTTDSTCTPLNTATDAFVCVDAGSQPHCVTPRPFDGANCDSGADCVAARGEICSIVDRQGMDSERGECRVPCSDAGTCDPQGGLPHGCLRGSCYPGVLGIPCAGPAECIEPLSCLPIIAEKDITPLSTQLCTMPCGVDGGTDADADSQCQGSGINGYCANGTCRLVRAGGQPCMRDAQCGAICDPITHTCPPSTSN
jgi:hypothetical protein